MKPVSTTTHVLFTGLCAAFCLFAATQISFANSAEGVPAPAASPGIGPDLDPTPLFPIFPPPPPQPQPNTPTNGTWITNTSSTWSTTSNWSGGTIADGGGKADFSTVNITTVSGRTTTIDTTSRTLGEIDIGDTDNSSPWTITASGGASLIFDNTANSANAILNATVGSAGVTFASALPILLNSSLDITNASSTSASLTINGTIGSNTAGTKTITTSTGSVIFGGTVSDGTAGAVAITQNGPGTLTLGTSANTYSGGTTIAGGKISIGSSGTPLGSGTLTLAGGNLVSTGNRAASSALANNVNITADSAITTTSSAASVLLPFTGTLTGSGGTLTLRNDAPVTTGQFEVRFSGNDYTMNQPIVIDNGAGGGTTRLSDFNAPGTTHTYNGVISGNGGFNRSISTGGGGTTVFNANNTYTGPTSVHAGTLQINNTNSSSSGRISGTSNIQVDSNGTFLFGGSSSWTDRVNDNATVTLNGGKFNTGGLSEHGATNNTAGIGALTLSATSIIDMGAGNSIVAFANSSAATWVGTLSIYNWTGTANQGGGTDQLYFGSDNSGLTNSQLSSITFYSDSGTTALGVAEILANGEIVPVPEPATWFAGSLAIVGIGGIWLQRIRRRRAIA